jgi:phosphatidylcholine synthase
MNSRLAAWGVHLFTASGAVWGLFALLAIAQERWILAFWLMAAALAIDSFDGMLARWAHVKEVTPGFNGELLDNIIDYISYVTVPAFFIYQASLLPRGWDLAAVAAICLASAYQFCQPEAKTDDNYFKGFPSYWNATAFYLFFLGLSPWANLAIVAVFLALVFIPIKWIYPSRMAKWRGLTILLTILWGLCCLAILIRYPEPSFGLVYGSLGYIAYYILVSLYLYGGRTADVPE